MINFLRSEKKFGSLDELIGQITNDVTDATEYLDKLVLNSSTKRVMDSFLLDKSTVNTNQFITVDN